MAIAIVLAGGSGNRMKTDVAKQYLKIDDKEVLYYSLDTFNNSEYISEIILVTRQSDIDFCREQIVLKYKFDKVTKIIAGGSERYDSVYNGMCAINADYDGLVMIHDGARPFVSEKMIADSVSAANEFGACTVGMPVKDTIKIIDNNNFGIHTPDRNTVYQIQTPQTFRYALLTEAYHEMYKDENHKITDDTMLVEQYIGVRSKVIEGSYINIKITTPEDIEIAQIMLEKKL